MNVPKKYICNKKNNYKKSLIFAVASPKQPAPEIPPGWERSKGNRS